MSDDDRLAETGTRELAPEAPPEITPEAFAESFGEDIRRTLDVATWTAGEDLAAVYRRTEAEIRDAVAREEGVLRRIRRELFPRLAGYPGAPLGAGVHRADLATLERVHRGLLFNGGVEACDGTRQVHDTLALTIYQIGVGLVSYRGDQGTFGHRLFRRDLRVATADPTDEMIELLERRSRRGVNQPDRRGGLSDLAQGGIMAYAERAILLRRSTAPWRLGHGSPAPYELITGSGSLDLMIEATKVVRELIEGHQKFLFVSSEPADRVLHTIGQALHPLEYAVVGTLRERIERTIANGHYGTRATADTRWDGERLTPEDWIRRFRDAVAPQVVVGVYRATRLAPAQVFYAHAAHADLAAHIALADSILQEHRGFPLLIDLADTVCRSVFGGDTLSAPVATAYADAGAPWRFLSERLTRR
ncbi:MAG TPA: hypothetical protein VFL91_12675 [Thermomicrobiales bacterium]|nr:hypothetical protein [Thermomicrobiales bacterium]